MEQNMLFFFSKISFEFQKVFWIEIIFSEYYSLYVWEKNDHIRTILFAIRYSSNWKIRWNFIIHHMFIFKKIYKKSVWEFENFNKKKIYGSMCELNRLYNMLLWTMSYSLRYWPTFHLNLDFYYRLTLIWLWTFQLIQLIMKMVTRWYFCFLVCSYSMYASTYMCTVHRAKNRKKSSPATKCLILKL